MNESGANWGSMAQKKLSYEEAMRDDIARILFMGPRKYFVKFICLNSM